MLLTTRARTHTQSHTTTLVHPPPHTHRLTATGVFLGMLLTVAFQIALRWFKQQQWVQQVLEALDLRRLSGREASTSAPGVYVCMYVCIYVCMYIFM